MKVDLTIPDPVAAPLAVLVTVTLSDQESDQYVRVNWGDGTPNATMQVASGGSNSASHAYSKEGYYKVAAQSNEVSVTQSLKVGTPDFAAPGAAFKRGQKIIEEDTAAIFGTTSKLG